MSSVKLLAIGNPLLDMSVSDGGEELLKKYNLKANDAILAEPTQMPIYEEFLKEKKPHFLAGGAGQNAARSAAYVLPEGSVAYTGCVGDDDLADRLRAANDKEGLESAYLVKKGQQTGACAVVITGHDRSLCTTLRAAEQFDVSHLSSPPLKAIIDSAEYFYIEGFFLTHGLESVLHLCKTAAIQDKTVILNLSAPFLLQFFKAQVDEIIEYSDVIIGNETEAEAWATGAGVPTGNLEVIAEKLAGVSKINHSKPRTVVITHGPEATILASGSPVSVKTFPVKVLSDSEIVDTNGAGDMFAGGFVGSLVLGKSLEESIAVGQKLGAMCCCQLGPSLKFPKESVV